MRVTLEQGQTLKAQQISKLPFQSRIVEALILGKKSVKGTIVLVERAPQTTPEATHTVASCPAAAPAI